MSAHGSSTTHPPGPENRLARETSPYLLQHKHNPVAWWPWGPEALAEAQASGKPILLSVGYAACHWCHVMAHESFEDDGTAAVMNELFVNIKVDREERPDIDQIYMSALHHLGEQGGWPLTMFLTPKGEPVWGGTYFPKTSRYGRPAFVDVLREVSRLFREEPEKIGQNRDALMERLAERGAAGRQGHDRRCASSTSWPGRSAARSTRPTAACAARRNFPTRRCYELLWRAGLRTGDARVLRADRAHAGAHLRGRHLRPSRRRLLALLGRRALAGAAFREDALRQRPAARAAGAGLCAHRQSAVPRSARAETVGWLTREMTTPEGAFSASLDADSEGEEGKFYVWSKAEMVEALGAEDAAFFVQHYDVTDEGNFEGHNILNRLNSVTAQRGGRGAARPCCADKLLMLRSKRVRPGLDDKVLADWNGLMIAALANAGTMLDEPAWIEMAARAFAFIARSMTKGRPARAIPGATGRLLYPGLASDFASMIRAALALYEATGQGAYLEQALAWQRAFDAHYANPGNGGYFLTADDAEGLVVRPASTSDDATPNPNAIAAQNLVRLAALTGDDAWREQADRLFDGVLARRGRQSAAACRAAQRARSAAARGRDRGDRARTMRASPRRR